MPQPSRAAVLGSPVAHSLSPVLHLAAYDALGLRDWTYTAIECDEAGLPAVLATPGWAGLSLTMPLKRAVLPLLDRTEPLAVEVGGANTVVFERGERHGYNTDVPGMVAALAEAGVTAPSGATILRPVEAGVRDGDLLVSTVPAGAADPYAERAWFSRPGVPGVPAVLDVVYNPWPTPLAQAAARSGAVVVSGFDLLLHQAERQVELMTGIKPAPLSHMRTAGHAELTRRATA